MKKTAPSYIVVPSSAFPFPTFPLSLQRLRAVHEAAKGTRYRLGAKAASTAKPHQLGEVDCSGYVGWLLVEAENAPGEVAGMNGDLIGRGSWHLDQWAKRCGFKRSHVDSGKLHDDCLRLAVTLAARNPVTGRMGIGHIALVLNGYTMESHGGKGVNSREWTGQGWQSRCHLYALTMPRQEKP